MNPDLQQAAENLQAGRKPAARAILGGYLRQHPNDETAWLMMSQAVDSAQQQADCLRQVLRINPQHPAAQRLLNGLSGQAAVTPPAPPGAVPRAWEEPPARAGSVAPRVSEARSWQAHPAPTPLPAMPPRGEAPSTTATPAPPAASAPAAPMDDLRRETIIEKERTAAKPTQAGKTRKPRLGCARLAVLLLIGSVALALVCGSAALVGVQLMPGLLPPEALALLTQPASIAGSPPKAGTQEAPQAIAPTAAPSATPRAGMGLPPTWTPTPTFTATPTRTITPTPSPTMSPTPMLPPPTALALMDRIQQEVSDMRGLPIKATPPRYLVSRTLIGQQLKAELQAGDGVQQLEDQARYLSALTLIKPTYDMVRYAMNGMLDGIGGFYRPETKEIYVLEIRFGGMEHIIYSHEFDHALVDQHYDLTRLQKNALCEMDSDRCMALKALVEGDATLLMYQWFKQYASPQDYQDILRYRPPAQALPEQFPPDYVVQSLNFPYDTGMNFVEYFHKQGNWKRVNELYAAPPTSTEQIMHPEKYTAGEQPIPVLDPDIQLALGSPWRSIANDTLGELTTFLMLGYSADQPARRGTGEAAKAAAGWGGDRVQVLYNDSTNQTVMAIHWVWDTTKDADEFENTAAGFMDAYSRGGRLTDKDNCWQTLEQLACSYRKDNETLLIAAPDAGLLEQVRALFNWP